MASKAKKKKPIKAKLTAKPKAKAKAKLTVKTRTKVKAKVKAKAKPAPKKKVAAKKAVAKKALPIKKPIALKSTKNVDYSKAITPLGDRLVVRVTESEKVTAGGIIIPDSASQASGYLKATVLAVGNGATSKKGLLRPLDVKKGDTVLFSQHAGTKVEFNSEELQIIHETDVMGIIQP